MYFNYDYNIKIYSISNQKVVTTQKVIADLDVRYQIENSPSIMTNKGIFNVFYPEPILTSYDTYTSEFITNGFSLTNEKLTSHEKVFSPDFKLDEEA